MSVRLDSTHFKTRRKIIVMTVSTETEVGGKAKDALLPLAPGYPNASFQSITKLGLILTHVAVNIKALASFHFQCSLYLVL